MHSDFALETGDSHRICEDYGRANNSSPEYPFVVICDGCSDPRSSDVDFGARILAKAVENFILLHVPMKDADFVKPAITQAAAQAKGLGLNPQCLDCTLMIARVVNGGDQPVVQVDCWGDGAIMGMRKDGTIDLCEIVFPSGCPFYPNYYTDQSRMANFAPVGEKILRHYTISPDYQTVTPAPEEKSSSPDTHKTFNVADYQYVTVTSDGIESFYVDDKLKGRQARSIIEITTGLGGYKGGKGQFVQRRFNSFVKDARLKGINHYDDITVGAIYLGE